MSNVGKVLGKMGNTVSGVVKKTSAIFSELGKGVENIQKAGGVMKKYKVKK